ncbi:hypothetical protein LTR10_013177 [Elasticomyces elasticus]|uniref:Clr5 domain-containing protein n=1 Tax=Exophiala sideris TaxID=1016849 RepID=A0ABR0JBB5_9EURO|nr:hypothetical protein LTR10_013177 [Elasticomyces elasticus]KAK5030552.1 hypothetical protein LTS07_005336 [Exophiala sideris]KAK5038606.1 hypothetical protein LTR13_004353 [Exophiala sideris]KAK5060487.1 hypothetical protein LTR69_005804 [Exophiala sideris]KAK5183399.1 hypothetical protein LTR44_004400 [Eurotiomycetes sp. CCFEE 6388]
MDVVAQPLGFFQEMTLSGTTSWTSDSDEMVYQFNEQPNNHRKVNAPSPDQWNGIKDIFTQLYLVENRKLKDVKTILSKKHGFNASEKMYKRRITEWKIRKNYKAQEKAVLAKRVKAYVDAGRDIQSLSFNGRPVKLDRVKRHCRTDKRLVDFCQLIQSPEATSGTDATTAKEDTPSTTTPIRLTPATKSSSSPNHSDLQMEDATMLNSVSFNINIRPPEELHTMETTLFHTRESIQWQFTSFKPVKLKELRKRFPGAVPNEVSAGCLDQASAFWLQLHHGFNFLQSGRPTEGFKYLDDCCKLVQPLLVSAPLHLLSCLLLNFATPWENMNALEKELLEYVSAMASRALSPYHPLAKAMRMITSSSTRGNAVEPMMNMIVAKYSEARKLSSSSVFALRVDQIDLLCKRKKFDQAVDHCQQLIDDSRYMSGKRYRTALAAFGRLRLDQGDEFAVEGIAHRILEHADSDPVMSNSGGTTTWACEQLAVSSMNRGDYRSAETYLRRAVRLSYQQYLHRGSSTSSLLGILKACLGQQGRKVKIDDLCKEMGLPLERSIG